MTYKTLRRKSDGQWMRVAFPSGQVFECTHPSIWNNWTTMEDIIEAYEIDPTELELIEVTVIPTADIPTDDQIRNIKEPYDNDKQNNAYKRGMFDLKSKLQ